MRIGFVFSLVFISSSIAFFFTLLRLPISVLLYDLSLLSLPTPQPLFLPTTMNDLGLTINDLINKAKILQCSEPTLQLASDYTTHLTTQKLILVGKVIFTKIFPTNTIKATLKKSWATKRRFQVAVKGTNIFQFTFKHEVDVHFVLQNRLWTIQNQHSVH